MGYTLTIGELEVTVDDEFIWLGAEGVKLDEAPAFNEPTDHTNSRWPSYTAWAEFCRDAGIEPLFYGTGWQTNGAPRYGECPEWFHRERPLLAEHPGAFPITGKDATYVEAALAAYRAANPNAKAGFQRDVDGSPVPDADDNTNATLARLEWLAFWLRWAVDNCKRPVVANS